MNHQRKPSARKAGIVVKKVDKETLIYDTESHQARLLNENAALIWNHCDGNRSISELSDLIRTSNTVAPITVGESENLVRIALAQLEKSNLLDGSPDKQQRIKGLSRRQLMKAAGIAVMIALPVVSTIVAPTAAQASTCLASGQPCGTSAECCSGLCSGSVCV